MRLHLFEFCDASWVPRVLREAETNYLATAVSVGRVFAPLAPVVARAMREDDRIVDLAAGGGGPWPALAEDVAKLRGRASEVTLTDLYPNDEAYDRLGYTRAAQSVDARNVPAELAGTRTMFDGLHHLQPADARAVLADAHRAGQPIVIGEAMGRRISTILTTLLIPLFVLILTPRVRPVSVIALVFTYLIPILPLMITWDGLVSALRTYTPAELREMTAGLDDFHWEAGELRHRGVTITYLVGVGKG